MLTRASKILSVVAVVTFSNLLEAQTVNWGPAGPVYTAGRARNMLVDRNNSNMLWVGSSTSGLFRSSDGGGNWAPINDQEPVKNLSYIAQSIDGTIYAVTGEGYLRYSQKVKVQSGKGLYKLVNTDLVQVAGSAVTGSVINRLACSPLNALHLAIASNLGIMISKDGGATFNLAQGIPTGTAITGMDVKFDGAGKLYCSAGNERGHNLYNTVRSKVYRSTDATLSSFTDITPYSSVVSDSLYGRIELAIAPSNNNIIYASIANKNPTLPGAQEAPKATTLKALFVSDNGGDAGTWGLILQGTAQLDPLTNGATIATGDYAHVLTVSPGNPDDLFVGGYQTYLFRRNRNGGSTLFPIGTWLKIGSHQALNSPYYLHQNVHDIKIVSGSPIKFYFITDAGIYRSIDLASATDVIPPSFQRFYKGLITGQFNSVSIERYPTTETAIKDTAFPYSGFIGGTSGNGLVYYSGTSAKVTQESTYSDPPMGGEIGNVEYSKVLPDAALSSNVAGSMYRSSNVKSSIFVPLNVNRYTGVYPNIAPVTPQPLTNQGVTTGTPFRIWENYGSRKVSPDSTYFYNDTLRFQASMQGVATLTSQTTFTFDAPRPNKFALIDSIAIRTATVIIPTKPEQITVPFTGADKKDIYIKLAPNYTVNSSITVPPISSSVGPVLSATVALNRQTLLDKISVTFTPAPFATKTLATVGANDAAAYYRVYCTVFYKYNTGDSITIVDNLISTKTHSYSTALKKPLSWSYAPNPSFTITANVNASIPSPTYILNPGSVSQSNPNFVVTPAQTTTYTINQRGTYTLNATPVVYTITAVTSSVMPTPTYVLMPDNVTQSVPDFTVNPVTTTSYTITELSSAETTESVIATKYLANPGNYTASNVYIVTPTVNTVYTVQAISTNTAIGKSTSVTYTTFAVNTTSVITVAPKVGSAKNPLVKVGTYYSARLAMALQSSLLTAGGDAIVVAKNPLSLNDPLNIVRISQTGCYTDDATGKPTFNTINISGKPILLEWSKSGTELYYATSANKVYRVSHITDIMDLSPSSFSGKFYTDVFKYSDPVTASSASLNPETPYRTTEVGSFTKPITSISVSNDDKSLLITFNEPVTTNTVVVMNNGDIRTSNSSNIVWANKTGTFPSDMGTVNCSLFEYHFNTANTPGTSFNQVYLGTDIGVFRTLDITANPPTWTNVNNNQLPRIQVFDIEQQTIEPWGTYNSGVIYVATNGRGVWSTDAHFVPYIVGVEELEERITTTENNITMFPNPTTTEVTIRFDGVQGENAVINVMDLNGRIVRSENLGKLDAMAVEHKLQTGDLTTGLYIVNISSNSGINRVAKLIVTK